MGLIAHTSAPESCCFTICEAPSSTATEFPTCHQDLRLGAGPLLMGCTPPRPLGVQQGLIWNVRPGRVALRTFSPSGGAAGPDAISADGPRFCSRSRVCNARGTKVTNPDLVCGPARVSEKLSRGRFSLVEREAVWWRGEGGGLKFGVRSN